MPFEVDVPIGGLARTVVRPRARVTFDGTGGTPPYTFAFASGGNRSRGSIDSVTGEYEAGPDGPVEDTIVVTDDVAATGTAQVSVTSDLYRDYQSLTPAGPQGENLALIERTLGGEKDVQFERARQATLAAMPTAGAPDALDVIADDRMLPRAASESPADDGGANDQAMAERLRTMWTSQDGWSRGGGHEGILRALSRAGFPTGDPDGAHVIQRTKLVSWLAAGVLTFTDHTGWTFDGRPPSTWHQFGILFGADFTAPGGGTLEDGDPSADLLNALVRLWKPGKARFMGTWVVISEAIWGWPIGVEWGDVGRVWGGSSRFVAP